MRRIILCADDYAADGTISEGILELAAARRISAVSCMTTSTHWKAAGKLLSSLPADTRIGLHFDLSVAGQSSSATIRQLILRSLTGRHNPQDIQDRLQRQWDAFTTVTGRQPDFMDGHQHVHALPGISPVVHKFLLQTAPKPVPLRSVRHFFGPTDAPVKRAVIASLACAGEWRLKARAPALNTAFAGDYSLTTHADYRGLLGNWLKNAPDNALLMCHPSKAATDPQEHAGARLAEYNCLRSNEFLELLLANNIELAFSPPA